MKSKFKHFGIYLPIFILVLVASVTLRTTALFLNFSFYTGYFSEKLLIGISNAIVVAAILFFISYLFFTKQKLNLIADFTSSETYVPTGLIGAALIFLSVHLFSHAGEVGDYIDLLFRLGDSSSLSEIPTQRILLVIVIITAIFALLSTVHFALTAVVEHHSSVIRAAFGLCTVVFLSLYSVYLYFNSELPMNSPNKSLDEMAYLASALFFLYETRLSLGREKWRAYISFGFIASLLTAYSSIPSLIIYFKEDRIISNSIYETSLTLALFIFISSRLLLTLSLIEDKPSEIAKILDFASKKRSEEIDILQNPPEVVEISGEPLSDTPDGADDNQISIDDMTASAELFDSDGLYAENPTGNMSEDA